MCSYLVYPSFPLIGVVGSGSLGITLPDASGPKPQILIPHGRVKSSVPDTLEVTHCSQRSLGTLGVFSAIPKVLLPHRSLACACSKEFAALGPGPMEVVGSGLVP